MRAFQVVGRAWAWGSNRLPEDRADRYLTIAVLGSLFLHALVGGSVLFSGWLNNPVIASRGEPLFMDIAPDKPKETAPPGDPSRPVSPGAAQPEKPRPVAPPPVKAQQPSPPAPPPAPAAQPSSPPVPPGTPAPRIAEAPKPTPPPPVPRAEEPAYEGTHAQIPSPPQTAKAQPETQPQQPAAPSPGSEPRVASVRAPSTPPPAMTGRPGGGGIFQGSQGGVVGQPVPLDTPDPNYREYMQIVRQRIYANWRFPSEAQNREMRGRLVIEFHIGKDGQLLKAEIVESSGEGVLDISAMKAVRLAERYPPLPAAMERDVLPIVAIFSYNVRSSQSSTFQILH